MSPLLPLLLKLFSNAFHPLLGTDEAMLVLALRHFGHQYLIAGLDQPAHVLEADQTIELGVPTCSTGRRRDRDRDQIRRAGVVGREL